jgi:hypothetical protein
MIDFENGFGKWIVSVPDAAVLCGETVGCVDLNMKYIVYCLMLQLLFSV